MKPLVKHGVLLHHYYPYQVGKLERGTLCNIVGDDGDTYEVKFDVPGYAGVYRINKSSVKEVA